MELSGYCCYKPLLNWIAQDRIFVKFCKAWGILVRLPGIELQTPAIEVQSPTTDCQRCPKDRVSLKEEKTAFQYLVSLQKRLSMWKHQEVTVERAILVLKRNLIYIEATTFAWSCSILSLLPRLSLFNKLNFINYIKGQTRLHHHRCTLHFEIIIFKFECDYSTGDS